MRIALGVEYDGTRFYGWQVQPGTRTVQGCIERALSKVADHPLRVITAGRTDTGVHALGQVIHFDTDAVREEHSWVFGANAHLPDDCGVVWARRVDDDFSARFSATARHYRYVIFNRAVRPGAFGTQVSWCYRPLTVEWMQAAAHHLVGEHDFSSYRALSCQAKHAVRTVQRLDVVRQGELVVIDIVANAFLQHMVRNIAGVLMTIGAGERPPEWAREVLEARDRTLGGVTATPHGLTLMAVDYPARFGLPRPTAALCF
ncbi:MAG: tRNA pseudouridine(38-40) synthase TruA [Gammaproteobacteria bacterium]|nr:tRNA pseudouridine(38-40) synthase TruA [Gammaproteobacteria bacterium]